MAENDEIMKYDDIYVSEEQPDINTVETVDVIEVADIETYDIDTLVAFPALGEDNEYLKHALLNGRELHDQHPITAITGLREELDEIERLKSVYSDEKNQADYYLWEDENMTQDARMGLFVTLCEDTRKIKICMSDDCIFGVTVPMAAFIGGQDNIPRDFTHGLVASSGVVAVKSELLINVGDYVVPNDYGYATKSSNGYGYKVFALEEIGGTTYAVITLNVSGNTIHTLSSEVNSLNKRVDTTERNIVAAMNVATEAHNKANEVVEVSDEAIKKALEALDKSDFIVSEQDDLRSDIEQTGVVAAQAREIAETAATTAITARDEAVETSNDALSSVNLLINDLNPIMTWEDAETGNSGAEYFVNHIQNGLATKTEVLTVETKTDDNTTAIAKNAHGIQSIVASVDKYSVGEYSQSYGLTQEKASNILKDGMVYIPTKHSDGVSHSETYSDTGEVNEFTPGYYYTWNGNDWIESESPLVAFFSEEPLPSGVLQYWYIDSNEAPDGYEAHALYVLANEQWQKVNILDGNVNNRITSMVKQTAENVSAEVVNARGSYAGLDLRITDVESTAKIATFWKTSDIKSNLGAIELSSSDDGSTLALVVMNRDGEQQLSGANIVLGSTDEKSYISFDADAIHLEGYTTINNGFSVDMSGNMVATSGSIAGWDITSNALSKMVNGKGTGIQNPSSDTWSFAAGFTDANDWATAPFRVDHDGNMVATSGEIGGWTITSNTLSKMVDGKGTGIQNPSSGTWSFAAGFTSSDDWSTAPFRVDHDGKLYASGVDISGNINVTSGKIGNWNISNNCIENYQEGKWNIYFQVPTEYGHSLNGTHRPRTVLEIYDVANKAWPFLLMSDGTLYANRAIINGEINATSGSFDRDVTIGGRSLANWITDGGYVYNISATMGTIGDWTIEDSSTYGCTLYGTDADGYAIRLSPQKMYVTSASYTFSTTWYKIYSATASYANTTSEQSDINVKNNISLYDDSYDIFFDNLSPCKYKYNFGTSNRFHTGFIAQEIVEALEVSGLTTQDFAGVIHLEQPDSTGSEWLLRRDEFVALNTWQIQKAKARITELENRVAQLESLINKE